MAVLEVNDGNIKQVLSENDRVIVKYFASWCGNCRLIAPKFKRISNEEKYQDIAFIEVDAEENPDTRHLATIDNLPYFAIFRNGSLVEGISASKEEAILELLEKL